MSADIRAAYDAWAPSYDHDENRTRDLEAERLRLDPPVLAGMRVLEIACGTGKNSSWLADRSASLVSTDLSWGMLLRARQRLASTSGVRWLLHDIARPWPFRTRSFDTVVISLVLEHIARIAPVYTEAARVLSDRGELQVAELHPARQARGARARYLDGASGELRQVMAWEHPLAEHLAAAAEAGLEPASMEEPRVEGDDVPRLLRLRFRR